MIDKVKKKLKQINNLVSNDYQFAMIIKIALFVLSILNTVFINRFLGPTLKGEYAYYLNIVNIIIIILNLGVYQAYPYYKKNGIQDAKNYFFNLIFLQFLINLILVSLVIMIDFNLVNLIVFLLIPVTVFSRQISFISLVENLRLKIAINILSLFLYSIGLLLIVLAFNPNIYIVLILLYLQEIAVIFMTLNKFKFRLNKKYFDLNFFKKVIRFGFLPMLTVLLSTLNYQVDVFIIKDLLDYRNLGIYSVAISFANIIGLIPNVFQEVLYSRSTKNDLLDETINSLKITFYINIFMVLIFLIFGKSVIVFLYGDSFINAAFITVIIICGMIPMTFFKIISSILVVKGDKAITFFVLLISVISNVGLNYMLIPKMGISGAAIASAVSYAFSGITILIYFCKVYAINIFFIFVVTKEEIFEYKKKIKMIILRKN